ncbi:MAG: hypothetical protein J2P19_21375 [Pseudonocardia sp.]|nr:hypothetical protein [Pseudonocardia sp.]
MAGKHVYAVHAVRPEEICATEVIFTSLAEADKWAIAVSTDPGVLAGAVTRYRLDSPGERHPESLYIKGERQQVAHLSDDREVAANGYLTSRSLRTAKPRM